MFHHDFLKDSRFFSVFAPGKNPQNLSNIKIIIFQNPQLSPSLDLTKNTWKMTHRWIWLEYDLSSKKIGVNIKYIILKPPSSSQFDSVWEHFPPKSTESVACGPSNANLWVKIRLTYAHVFQPTISPTISRDFLGWLSHKPLTRRLRDFSKQGVSLTNASSSNSSLECSYNNTTQNNLPTTLYHLQKKMTFQTTAVQTKLVVTQFV